MYFTVLQVHENKILAKIISSNVAQLAEHQTSDLEVLGWKYNQRDLKTQPFRIFIFEYSRPIRYLL